MTAAYAAGAMLSALAALSYAVPAGVPTTSCAIAAGMVLLVLALEPMLLPSG